MESKYNYIYDIFTHYLVKHPEIHRCGKCARIYNDKRDKVCPRCGSEERALKINETR